MTSDTASAPSQARQNLDLALGEKRVSLSALHPEEFDTLLRDWLHQVKLKELRGFKPIKDLIAFRPGSTVYGGPKIHTLDVEVLDVADDCSIIGNCGIQQSDISLSSPAISVSRGSHFRKALYCRHESDEKTSDREIARSWGTQGYHHRGQSAFLGLGRFNQHARADNSLIEIHYWYKKVPHEDRYVVHLIHVTAITIDGFRERFDEVYGMIALNLIWELERIHQRTRKALESQAVSIGKKELEFDRIGNSITE